MPYSQFAWVTPMDIEQRVLGDMCHARARDSYGRRCPVHEELVDDQARTVKRSSTHMSYRQWSFARLTAHPHQTARIGSAPWPVTAVSAENVSLVAVTLVPRFAIAPPLPRPRTSAVAASPTKVSLASHTAAAVL